MSHSSMVKRVVLVLIPLPGLGACRDGAEPIAGPPSAVPRVTSTAPTLPSNPSAGVPADGEGDELELAATLALSTANLRPEVAVIEDEKSFLASSSDADAFALDTEIAARLETTYLSLAPVLVDSGFTAGFERDFGVERASLDDVKFFVLALGSAGGAADVVTAMRRGGFADLCAFLGGAMTDVPGRKNSVLCDVADSSGTQRVVGAVAADRFVAVMAVVGTSDPVHHTLVEGALGEWSGVFGD